MRRLSGIEELWGFRWHGSDDVWAQGGGTEIFSLHSKLNTEGGGTPQFPPAPPPADTADADLDWSDHPDSIAQQMGAVRLQTPGDTPVSSAHSSPEVDRADGVPPAKAYIISQSASQNQVKPCTDPLTEVPPWPPAPRPTAFASANMYACIFWCACRQSVASPLWVLLPCLPPPVSTRIPWVSPPPAAVAGVRRRAAALHIQPAGGIRSRPVAR